MEAEIFTCIDDDDVEGLKSLMHYPNLFQIEDDSGLTILQKAICRESFEVFDFLLSLDDFPINTRNSKGKTAVQFALDCCNRKWVKNFIYPLLQKGADIDWSNNQKQDSSTLELALISDRLDVVQYLIENGWDLNYQDSFTGQTPLHMIHDLSHNRNELLAMMLYFGGDPSIPDFNGFTPIDYAFKYGYLSESMLEHLIFYLFDDYSGYDIPFYSLFGLLKLESLLIPQILKYITSVNLDINNYYSGTFRDFVKDIFVMKPEYLKLLLEKFDYVIEAILDASIECHFPRYVFVEEVSIENCDLLLQSQFRSDVIQIISKIPIGFLTNSSVSANKPHSEVINLILFLLSYGANINDFDLELIYRKFGDCDFFRMLLHMDIKINEFRRYDSDIMPGLLYNIQMDMETFLSDPDKYECSPEALKQLLNYFDFPKLQDFCCRWAINFEDIHAKLDELPRVPLLAELARNRVRKFLIQKYKIKNSMQFYTLVKNLPISKVHQKIITLETKLY